MRLFWILLFASIPFFAVGTFIYGLVVGGGLWLPAELSTIGDEIDHLFYIILAITGVVFIAVEFVFIYFLAKYSNENRSGPVKYVHGNHTLETLWTVIPAGILVFIAIYQYGTWQDAKFLSNAPDAPLHARLLAGQFEWRFRYPGADGTLNTPDDLEEVNKLHVYKDQPVRLIMESRDVLHSFNIPVTRLKQDVVPGLSQPFWFTMEDTDDDPTQPDVYEIACTELCGWGHYKMRAHLIVHETKEEYDAWFAEAKRRQNADVEDLGLAD